MEEVFLQTPLGTLHLVGSASGLREATFLEAYQAPTAVIPEVLEDAVYQLQEYFGMDTLSRKRTQFDLLLDPEGTNFQKRVWRELQEIPHGKTVSYLDMAKALGDPKVLRAAASANGKNPIAIIIPCHRVIGSDGSLTGYAGGLHRKKWLLAHESPVKQTSLF